MLAGKEQELHQQVAAQQQWLQEAAVKLSLQRQAAGKKLKSAVESCLAQLAMEGCEFEVNIGWKQSLEVEAIQMPQAPPSPPPLPPHLPSLPPPSGCKALSFVQIGHCLQLKSGGRKQLVANLQTSPSLPLVPLPFPLYCKTPLLQALFLC